MYLLKQLLYMLCLYSKNFLSNLSIHYVTLLYYTVLFAKAPIPLIPCSWIVALLDGNTIWDFLVLFLSGVVGGFYRMSPELMMRQSSDSNKDGTQHLVEVIPHHTPGTPQATAHHSKFDIATYLTDQNSRELHTMQGAASTAQTVTNVVAGTNSSANAREKSLATWFQIALARKMKSPGWVCKIHPPHTQSFMEREDYALRVLIAHPA